MKVKELIHALLKLDGEREIQLGMYQDNLKAYLFRNGCQISQEYATKEYYLLPNETGEIKIDIFDEEINTLPLNNKEKSVKVVTYFDWVSDERTLENANKFLETVNVIDIKYSISENHESMLIMYTEK